MRHGLILFLLLLFASCSASADTITPEQAKEHVGKTVTVRGVVDNVFRSKKGNGFINFGGRYPNQVFSAWIPAAHADEFPLGNLRVLEGKTVSITGLVEVYKGAPQITVTDRSQVE